MKNRANIDRSRWPSTFYLRVAPLMTSHSICSCPLQALKSASEEYSHILDVVGRYAVYKAGVALTCKRQGEARADLHTLRGGSRLDAIR